MNNVIASIYTYNNGQDEISFNRGGPRDWYVWSTSRQKRLATYRTRAALMAAYVNSNNTDGPHGCADLRL